MSVTIPAKAHEEFDRYLEGRGLVKHELIGKILTWFTEQNDIVRRVVGKEIPCEMEGIYAQVLREIAAKAEAASASRIPSDGGPVTGRFPEGPAAGTRRRGRGKARRPEAVETP